MSEEVIVIETDNPVFEILTEEEVTEVLFVDGAGPRGDKGDKGDTGDIIRKDPEFTYDLAGNLVLVEYPDGSYKAFTYDNSVLTQIDYLLDGEIGTRFFVYSGDTLQRIEDN